MPIDNLLIAVLRVISFCVFTLLLVRILARWSRTQHRELRRTRIALAALWWALSWVSGYGVAIQIWPSYFANLNQHFTWGLLINSIWITVAAILSGWAFLPFAQRRAESE